MENDLEMIKEMGYCPGIENYSRYLDGRQPGQRPFCLIDYFPKDFVTFIDESHVTIPQIRAMYGGDHSRKSVLVEYGFRLPAAADNRPPTFDEFNLITGQKVYVSATPADYELERSEGLVVEQVVRPTGLLDPPVEVRPTQNQVGASGFVLRGGGNWSVSGHPARESCRNPKNAVRYTRPDCV